MSRQLQLSNASWLHFFHSSEFQRTSTQSHELRTFLGEKEIATSRTSYNPEDIKITVKLRSTTVWYGKQSAIGHWIPRIRQQSTGKMLSQMVYIPFVLRLLYMHSNQWDTARAILRFSMKIICWLPHPDLAGHPWYSLPQAWCPCQQTGPLVDEIELLQANPQ